jgi:hypothetical protein
LFWLTVSEVSVHGWLVPLLWAEARQNYHGRERVPGKPAHLMADRKQREEGAGDNIQLSRACLQ